MVTGALLASLGAHVAGMFGDRTPAPLWSRIRSETVVGVPDIPLEKRYRIDLPPPKLAFPETATRAREVDAWQRSARQKLAELLKTSTPADLPDVRTVRVDDLGDVVRETLVFGLYEGVEVPAFLIRPRRVHQPRAALLVVPGYSAGIRATAGLVDDYHHANALRLARAGYVTLTMELRGFGYLESMGTPPYKVTLERHVAYSLLRGKTPQGLTVSDLARGFRYLQSRPEVDEQRIGVVGFSSGGRAAILYAALEPRVAAIVASGCVTSIDSAVLYSRHGIGCAVPGLLDWFRMQELLGMLAPRPVLVHWGALDHKRAQRTAAFNPWALPTFREAKHIYEAAGHRSRLERSISREAGHEFSNEATVDFLRRYLPIVAPRKREPGPTLAARQLGVGEDRR